MNQTATLKRILAAPLPAAALYLGLMILLLFVVFSSLDRYLTQQVDQDLQRSSAPTLSAVLRGYAFPPERPEERAFSQTRYYIEVRDANGDPVRQTPAVEGDTVLPAPDLTHVTPTSVNAQRR